jgi:hypothetical protein
VRTWSVIALIGSGMAALLALAVAGWARLTAICPPHGTAHAACQIRADSEALDVLGYLLIPAAALLALSLLILLLGKC